MIRADEPPDRLRAEMEKSLGGETAIRRAGHFLLGSRKVEESDLDGLEETVTKAQKALQAQYFRKEPEQPVAVYLLANADDYIAFCRDFTGQAPASRFGFYLRDRKAMVMNIGTGPGTLVHEMTHALMDPDFPGCPSWFSEGLASLYEQYSFDADGRILGHENWRLPLLQRALGDRSAPSWKSLSSFTGAEFYGEGSGLRYAVARYLCLWLQEQGLLEDFYRAFRDSRANDRTGYETLCSVVGRPMDEVEKEWAAWARDLKWD